MIAQVELLLQYSSRFYARQFITCKVANDELLIWLEHLLSKYFSDTDLVHKGLPTI